MSRISRYTDGYDNCSLFKFPTYCINQDYSLEHHYLDNEICSSRDLGDGSFAAIQELSLKKNSNRLVLFSNGTLR